MKITIWHNRRIQAIIKQFGQINQDLVIKGIYGDTTATMVFNPHQFNFDRLRLIFKFISEFPDDENGDKISFRDISSKQLCDCELIFSSWLNNQGVSLPIFDEEWERLMQQYK